MTQKIQLPTRSLALMLAALCGLRLTAATLDWTGTVDSDWHKAANWSPAQVPTASDTVNLNSGNVTPSPAPNSAP